MAKRRPLAVAPPGHVTIIEAAEILGLSYSGVYQHIERTDYQIDAGVIMIPRRDLKKIKGALRKPGIVHDRVTIRPTPEEIKRWETAAKLATDADQHASVPQWMRALANAAAARLGVK